MSWWSVRLDSRRKRADWLTIGLKPIAAGILVLCGASPLAAADLDRAAAPPALLNKERSTHQAMIPEKQIDIRIVALDLKSALQLVSEQTGIRVITANDLQGQLEGVHLKGNISDTLDQITSAVGIEWWWDGTTVRVGDHRGAVEKSAQENARLDHGFGQELINTVRKIPGVLDASVHVVLAPLNASGQMITQPTASVLVHFDPALAGEGLEGDVRALVGSGGGGLTSDRVTVTVVPAPSDLRFAGAATEGNFAAASLGSSTGTVLRILMALTLVFGLAWLASTRLKRLRS